MVTHLVNVVDDLVGHDASGKIADDLVNLHDDTPGWVDLEAQWLDPGIDERPLPPPVVTHLAMTMDVSALHPIGPVDVGMHGRERAVDVAGIERVVGGSEHVAIRERRSVRHTSRAL